MNVFHYWFLSPYRPGCIEDGNSILAFDQTLNCDGINFEWSVFVDASGAAYYVRLLLNDVPDKELPENLRPYIVLMLEHLQTAINVGWNTDIKFFPDRMALDKDNMPKGVNLTPLSIPPMNAERINALFIYGWEIRELLKLFSDGLNSAIPEQYRYLSYYKILELEFKDSEGKWNFPGLMAALDYQSSKYNELKFSKTFDKQLHDIRDRCAHIQNGKGEKRRLGISLLSIAARDEVHSMLPLLMAICSKIINSKLKGNFIMPTELDSPELYIGKV